MHTIYTYGYQGTDPAALAATAERLGALVVDIRYSALSRDPRWSGRALSQLLGERYLYLRSLGNVNYRNGGPIQLAYPLQAVQLLRTTGTLKARPIILLCVCRDVTSCHRTVAAEYLAEQFGADVEHLPQPAVAVPDGDAWTMLSLNPCWGTLIAGCDPFPELGKHFETRSWRITDGARIGIYQTKGLGEQTARQFVERCNAPLFAETLAALGYARDGRIDVTELPRGAILATARVVTCHRTETIRDRLSPRELAFGDYSDGRWAWELADVRRLSEPVPATATKQKLWTWRGELG